MERATIKRNIGTLHDDMITLAGKVFQSLSSAPQLVWANDAGEVFIGDPSNAEEVSPAGIVGTFAFGRTIHEIEDDLRVVLRERAKHGMLE